ncbi:MAG: uroporphyrinogen decarboxylase [Geminicoccaceae bacterium]|nr:uroporphyrinogen decarboxylase [Geminicoccaceae bacterium]MDW8340439.1 uroporphyrinogen decarboxylase [Geminicoccaceae bacterium]
MADAPGIEQRERAEKPLLAVLRGRRLDPPPVWFMRQAGRYLPEYRAIRARARGFLDLCYDPELAVEVTLQPLRRFALDGAILFSDILVVPHALGVEVVFVEGEGPRLAPIEGPRELARLDPTRLHERLEPVYETLRRLRRALPPLVTLIGFAGMPWTLAAYVVEGRGAKDFVRARALARREPAFFAALVEVLENAVLAFLDRQIAAGAEAVQLFDSWAGVLPESELRRWCIEPARRIVAALRSRHPEVPIVLFPRGVGANLLHYRELGANALALDTSVPMAWAARALEGSEPLALQGNLDPVALLGPEEALVEEARAIVAAAAARPHVFNLGHGVLPETPPERLARLVESLKSGCGRAM